MDELLSMIDELRSKGIKIDELQLQKFIEVHRYLENAAEEFGGIVEQPSVSWEGCGVEFRCDYFDPTIQKQIFADMLRCCSELEIESLPDNRFALKVLIPGVFVKEDPR